MDAGSVIDDLAVLHEAQNQVIEVLNERVRVIKSRGDSPGLEYLIVELIQAVHGGG